MFLLNVKPNYYFNMPHGPRFCGILLYIRILGYEKQTSDVRNLSYLLGITGITLKVTLWLQKESYNYQVLMKQYIALVW